MEQPRRYLWKSNEQPSGLLKTKRFYKELLFSVLCPPYGLNKIFNKMRNKAMKNPYIHTIEHGILTCWSLYVDHTKITKKGEERFTEVWIPLHHEDEVLDIHRKERRTTHDTNLLKEASFDLSILQAYIKGLSHCPKYIFWFSNLAPLLARYGFTVYDNVGDFYKESNQYRKYFSRWKRELTDKEKQQKERIKKWKIPQVAMISTEDFLKIDFEKFIKK